MAVKLIKTKKAPLIRKKVAKSKIPHQHVLLDLVSLKRSSGTNTEAHAAAMIATKFARYLSAIDEAGNLLFKVGVSSRTLFCAHLDTVHRGLGGQNNWGYDGTHIYAEGAPLGADDAAGCEILAHLMENEVIGTYLFTRGEEVGGIGAKYFADTLSTVPFIGKFDRAIAFDRRGVSSVITAQAYGTCTSSAFADALCDELNNAGMLYMPDDSGVYTDTAEFVGVIPECTNISVGYENEHSDYEELSIEHLEMLKKAVLQIDWEGLPTVRDPKACGLSTAEAAGFGSFNSGSFDSKWWRAPDYEEEDAHQEEIAAKLALIKDKKLITKDDGEFYYYEDGLLKVLN